MRYPSATTPCAFLSHSAVEGHQKLSYDPIHYPRFLVGVVITVKIRIKLFETLWLLSFADDWWSQFVTAVSVGTERHRNSIFWLFDSLCLACCCKRSIRWHSLEQSSLVESHNA